MRSVAAAIFALAFLVPPPAAAAMNISGTFPGTTCTLFPGDSVFNTDISSLPVNAQSATWAGNMTQHANLHPDFGTPAQGYGIPINVAPPPSTGVAVTFGTSSESDHPAEGYPIDASTLIEGGPSAPAGSDRHALVINKNLCKLYEIYNLQNVTNGVTPTAGSGAVWDLISNAMRPAGWTSADAAGLPIAPLLLRPDEIMAGTIAHAIRFTAHCTSTYIWPASHQAGSCSSSFPPMGARFRLRSSFDISTFSAATQVVLRAFQHYGLILADNGSDWYFQGSTDNWWGTTAGSQVINELKSIPANQFDAIDEAGIQAAAGSYGTTPPCTTPVISASPASPSSAGGTVMVTASTTGCLNPQYQFWTRSSSGAWTMAQDYGAGSTFNWTSTTPAGGYYIGVHVKAGASSAPYDAVASISYTLTGSACTAVSAANAPPGPQSSGTPITITATGTCPGVNPQYEFWAKWMSSNTWQLIQPYSSSNAYHWNSSGAMPGTEWFGVWVRDPSSSAAYDAFTSIPVTVTAPVCGQVSVSVAPTSPQPHGTGVRVVFSAGGACPNPNPLFEFWMLPQGASTWQLLQAYSTSATYTWNTTGALAGTEQFSVWIRDARGYGANSGPMGVYDTYIGTAYTLA